MSCAFYNRCMPLRIVKMPGGERLSELPGRRKSRRKSTLYNRQTRAHPMIFLFFRLFCGALPDWAPFGRAAALPFKRNAAAFFWPAGKKNRPRRLRAARAPELRLLPCGQYAFAACPSFCPAGAIRSWRGYVLASLRAYAALFSMI